MKKISLLSTIIFAVLFIVSSCTPEREPTCTRRGFGTITEPAVFPDTIALGQSVSVGFTFAGNNGCSKFNGFDPIYFNDLVSPHDIYIPAPKLIDEGCVCTEMVPIFNESYSYFPEDTGAYYFYYTLQGDIQKTDTVFVY